MKRGIVLDRDGTLIDFVRDHERGIVTPAFHPDHVRLLPGVVEGLTALRDAGYAFAIATNQPDAAKGRLPVSAIERTNAALIGRLSEAGISIAQLEVCLHHPEPCDGGDPRLNVACECRKPKPAMLERIVEHLGWRRDDSWMIGDTASDLGAAQRAGLRSGLLMRHNRCELCVLVGVSLEGSKRLDVEGPSRLPDVTAPDLPGLAAAILADRGDPA